MRPRVRCLEGDCGDRTSPIKSLVRLLVLDTTIKPRRDKMGSRSQPLPAGQMTSQMHPSQQQLAFPASFWQPCPSQVMFNTCMAHPCPAAGQMFLQQQHSTPQVPNLGNGEQPPWFQALVTAVSAEMKNKGKDVSVADANPSLGPKGASSSPGELSPEDEKVLLKALKKREQSGLTVQQVFKELSKTHGHEEIIWKTWFIANFEKLYPETACVLDSAGSLSGEKSRLGRHAGTSPRSLASKPLSWSSSTTVGGRSSGESEPSESESSDDEGLPLSPIAFNPRPQTSGGKAPTRRIHIPVTNSDLRAMALYICEKGDPETRRYKRSSWREFAERPRNQKRSLEAWISVPRIASHVARINQLVKKYQNDTSVAKSQTGLPVHHQQNRRVIGCIPSNWSANVRRGL